MDNLRHTLFIGSREMRNARQMEDQAIPLGKAESMLSGAIC